MPWAKFLEPFDFSPADKGGRVTVAYPADFVANVTRECFDQAKAAGKAVKVLRQAGALALRQAQGEGGTAQGEGGSAQGEGHGG